MQCLFYSPVYVKVLLSKEREIAVLIALEVNSGEFTNESSEFGVTIFV